MCTKAYMRVRVWAAMWRRSPAMLFAPASPAETTVVVPDSGDDSSAGMPIADP